MSAPAKAPSELERFGRRLRTRGCWRQATCRCRIGDRHRQFFLAAAAIHPGRGRATPTTPVEIDGATQVWDSSARYAQFRAPAFPSPVPCRSRYRALAGLARARTSDDIRPRALCIPPPKSFARTPGPLQLAMLPRATRCGHHRFAPGVYFGANSDLCATAYLRAVRVRDLCAARSAGWVPRDFEARSTWPTSDKGRGIGCRLIRPHKQCLLMGERL